MIKFTLYKTLPENHLKIYKCFVNYCVNELKINGSPNIIFLPMVNDFQITTGGYDRTNKIFCREEKRALIDCCRTIAHELIHMSQLENNSYGIDEPVQDIGGQIEDEANAVAGQLIKKFVKEFDCKFIYEL